VKSKTILKTSVKTCPMQITAMKPQSILWKCLRLACVMMSETIGDQENSWAVENGVERLCVVAAVEKLQNTMVRVLPRKTCNEQIVGQTMI